MGAAGRHSLLRGPLHGRRRRQPRMVEGRMADRARLAVAMMVHTCRPTHDTRCALVWGGAGLLVGSVVLIVYGVHANWPMWLRGVW